MYSHVLLLLLYVVHTPCTGWIVFYYYYFYILRRVCVCVCVCGPIIRRVYYCIHTDARFMAGVQIARGDTGRWTLFMAGFIRNIIKRFLDIRYRRRETGRDKKKKKNQKNKEKQYYVVR